VAVAAALILGAGPAAAQTITWQMANEYPATSIHGEGDQFFARELWERSGGRIVITHSFDASLGYRSKDLLQAVARGTVVLGDMYVGALGDVHPIFSSRHCPSSPSPRRRPASSPTWRVRSTIACSPTRTRSSFTRLRGRPPVSGRGSR
jgi:hypothetical protein